MIAMCFNIMNGSIFKLASEFSHSLNNAAQMNIGHVIQNFGLRTLDNDAGFLKKTWKRQLNIFFFVILFPKK